jgi:hypothetical protein
MIHFANLLTRAIQESYNKQRTKVPSTPTLDRDHGPSPPTRPTDNEIARAINNSYSCTASQRNTADSLWRMQEGRRWQAIAKRRQRSRVSKMFILDNPERCSLGAPPGPWHRKHGGFKSLGLPYSRYLTKSMESTSLHAVIFVVDETKTDNVNQRQRIVNLILYGYIVDKNTCKLGFRLVLSGNRRCISDSTLVRSRPPIKQEAVSRLC